MGKQLLEKGVMIEDCIGTARKRAQIVLHIHQLQVYNHHQLQVLLASIDRANGQFKVRLLIGVYGLGSRDQQEFLESVNFANSIETVRKHAKIVLLLYLRLD
mmetsp:Transcript_13380/g.20304  ORF Transcript_13380/g.20304 Transcript_13380/m.20304 type:complete len:102 (+) Transcript_13380:210-515(+)